MSLFAMFITTLVALIWQTYSTLHNKKYQDPGQVAEAYSRLLISSPPLKWQCLLVFVVCLLLYSKLITTFTTLIWHVYCTLHDRLKYRLPCKVVKTLSPLSFTKPSPQWQSLPIELVFKLIRLDLSQQFEALPADNYYCETHKRPWKSPYDFPCQPSHTAPACADYVAAVYTYAATSPSIFKEIQQQLQKHLNIVDDDFQALQIEIGNRGFRTGKEFVRWRTIFSRGDFIDQISERLLTCGEDVRM